MQKLVIIAMLSVVTLVASQYTNINTGYTDPYATLAPPTYYNNLQPTFSNLNTYSAYTTPYPYLTNAYSQYKIRIWPFVIGQYYNPNYNRIPYLG